MLIHNNTLEIKESNWIELADADESAGPFSRSAAVPISDFAIFGKTAPVQPILIRFGIFEDHVKVDFFPSISVLLKSPCDIWSARSQCLKRGPISEFLAFDTQYFSLCNCFAKFGCISGVSAPKTNTTRHLIAKLRYEVFNFPCEARAAYYAARSLSHGCADT